MPSNYCVGLAQTPLLDGFVQVSLIAFKRWDVVSFLVNDAGDRLRVPIASIVMMHQ